MLPFIGRGRARDWYGGTADAVLQNLDFIADRDGARVVLAGDHVYKMDYRPFIEMRGRCEPTSRARFAPYRSRRRIDSASWTWPRTVG